MKKTLTLVVLAGLMLTGCGGKQEAASATAVAEVSDAVTVPSVMGLTLDKATDQLEDLGLKVKAEDTVDGKMIMSKENWQVTSQDPTEGAKVAKDSTVLLGVKNLDKEAAEKAAADKAAAEKAAAEKAAADKAAADKAAADKAAADKAAADAAAAKLAAEQAAAQQAAPQAPVQQTVPQAPAAVYYANCTAAKAAGAAPLYSGQPGYSTSLDRDRDGIACEN
ncbi:excalibur calcium-binding domain-containing protein [Arthrobacter sp. ISL-69]|uniref:excalibur calcium-binding domain-containing protein n=1 Tax=Arthrobacter sp. ISL-69 TaxID=2819113 RepID=UPI001BEC85BE|nr:excalibur calcium-binding domain-containing protein [Arthrobacter sp. ISL-69]MBT2535407.1 excalibur calcium-binding domain-containing protein [Arthrobacter sp. ISL-69]